MTYNPETARSILESSQHTFVGRAARNAEVRYMDSGKSVAKVRLAVSNGKDAEPYWFTVEAWDSLAEQMADSCEKGTSLRVTGRVVENRYQTKAGEDRCEVVIKAQDVQVLSDRAAKPRPMAAVGTDLPF